MGNQKQKWRAEEEEALLAGVKKHGTGKWRNILKDPEFAPFLIHRTNIDLKDKWRNLSVSNSQHRDKSRKLKIQSVATAQLSKTPKTDSEASFARNLSSNSVAKDLPHTASEAKTGFNYSAMIFEALSTIKDTNGSDISAIAKYIGERHEVAQSFRKSLSTRLKKLVLEGKLEKVQNCYKIPKGTFIGTKPPTPKQNDLKKKLGPSQNLVPFREILDEASVAAAYGVAEAENKSFLAAEAVREAERVSQIAEDTDAMLQLVKEIYERCLRGEVVFLA